jgi:uncharacterized protein YjbJ (UPF0337 family)
MDQQTEGRFKQAKGKIRSTWGDVTDDDVDRAQGNVESLVGTIQQKTGEATESIRNKLSELLGNGKDETDRRA